MDNLLHVSDDLHGGWASLDAVSVSGHHVVRAGGVGGPPGVGGHPGTQAGQHTEAHNKEHPQFVTIPNLPSSCKLLPAWNRRIS